MLSLGISRNVFFSCAAEFNRFSEPILLFFLLAEVAPEYNVLSEEAIPVFLVLRKLCFFYSG